MKNTVRCDEAYKIKQIINLDKPIPQDVAEHAQKCSYCLFWLSAILAANEACKTVKRIKLDTCPEKSPLDRENENCFKNLIIIGILLLQNREATVTYQAAKTILSEVRCHLEEFNDDYTDKLFAHSCECPLCDSYYRDLLFLTLTRQLDYQREIKNGGLPRPVVADIHEEIAVSRASFKENPDDKPN